MDGIPKFDIKADISFDISIKPTTYMDIRVWVEEFMVKKYVVEKLRVVVWGRIVLV